MVFGLGVVWRFAFGFPVANGNGTEVYYEAEFVFAHGEFSAEFFDVVAGCGGRDWFCFWSNGLFCGFLGCFGCGAFLRGCWFLRGWKVYWGVVACDVDAEDV